MEEYFEVHVKGTKVDYGAFCTYCKGGHENFTNSFKPRGIMSVLNRSANGNAKLCPKGLVNELRM